MKWNFYDWDDTIVLTRYAIFSSYKYALQQVKDIKLTPKEFDKLYANSNGYMAEHGFTSEEILEVKKNKNEIYLSKYWKDVEVLKNQFHPSEKHIIVSNTTHDVIYEMLEKLKLSDHFSQLIGSDVYQGVSRKPSPDLYNYAFSQIEHEFNSEEDTLIIHEDSEFGLNAALSFHEAHRDIIKNFKIVYKPIYFNLGSYI
jgi:phosphoglycolate phosphatase-like HAD superfamily hydrolase